MQNYSELSNASVMNQNCSLAMGGHSHALEMFVTSLNYIFVAPLFLVLGAFGNFMVYVVIGHVCPGTTTSVHFRHLAVFDSISAFIIVILPFTHYAIGFHILSMSRVACAGLTFLRYVSGDVAIWLVLVITVDRLIAVWQPLKVRRYCHPSTASRIMVALLCLAVVKNGHILFVRGLMLKFTDLCQPKPVQHQAFTCTTLKEYPSMYFFEKKIRPVIALITVSIIPVFGVAICNAFITALVCKNSKQWRTALKEEQTQTQSTLAVPVPSATPSACSTPVVAAKRQKETGGKDKEKDKRKSEMEKRMAKSERNSLVLTLTNSSAYFLFVLPSFILCLLRHELPLPFVVEDSFREDMLLAITDTLILANHTLNFYICLAASKSFREKVRQYSMVTFKRLGLIKTDPQAGPKSLQNYSLESKLDT